MKTEKEKIYTLDPEVLITSFVNLDPSGAVKSMADLCFQKGKEAGKAEAIKQVLEIINSLHSSLLSDFQKRELKSKIGELVKEQSSGEKKR